MAKQSVQQFKVKSDLELWDDSNLQGSLTHLPASFKLRQSDLLARPYTEFVERYKNSDSKAEREDAELQLRIVAWKIINIMRVDSGLQPTDVLPTQWDEGELTRPNWGNDFTPCSNPLNPKNNQNTISPRPGNWYRNMLLNWEIVVARLHFWEPESNPLVSQAAIERITKDNRKRTEALKACEFVDAMPKEFFLKTLKDYTAKLAKELTESATASRKGLGNMEPSVSAA